MEPKFQTSFIPKSPATALGVSKIPSSLQNKTVTIVGIVIFVIALSTSIGVFFYKNMLNGQLVQADKDLSAAREAFAPEKIQELMDQNAKRGWAKSLLEKHITTSELLLLIQSLVVKTIRATTMTYSYKEGVPTIVMDLDASSYNALADQSRIFLQNNYIINPNFLNFTLSDNGNVKSTFNASINPTLVSYKEAIKSLSINQ